MKHNKLWIFIISAVLILSTIGIAQIFTDEDSARAFRNSFKDYPDIIGQANITKISARLDDEDVVFEWTLKIDNKRDKTTEELRGGFEMSKADKDNAVLIETTLQAEVKREFEDYNKIFVPNPMVEYRNHPSWGKTSTITIK